MIRVDLSESGARDVRPVKGPIIEPSCLDHDEQRSRYSRLSLVTSLDVLWELLVELRGRRVSRWWIDMDELT